MTAQIFRDRRHQDDRRSKRKFAGRIHCRRRFKDRRRYPCEVDGKRWWLKINYVDRELVVDNGRQ
jgi:hypothetical protein